MWREGLSENRNVLFYQEDLQPCIASYADPQISEKKHFVAKYSILVFSQAENYVAIYEDLWSEVANINYMLVYFLCFFSDCPHSFLDSFFSNYYLRIQVHFQTFLTSYFIALA